MVAQQLSETATAQEEPQCYLVTLECDYERPEIIKGFESPTAAEAFRSELEAYQRAKPAWPDDAAQQNEWPRVEEAREAWRLAHPAGPGASNGDGFGIIAAPFVPCVREPSEIRGMESAPRDGTHILVKHVVSHYTDGNGRHRFKDYRPVGHKWAEFRFVDGDFRPWTGTDEVNQIGGGGEPIGWSPIPGAQEPTPRAVDLPQFDGYPAHIVRELQAAFVHACERAGIKVGTL